MQLVLPCLVSHLWYLSQLPLRSSLHHPLPSPVASSHYFSDLLFPLSLLPPASTSTWSQSLYICTHTRFIPDRATSQTPNQPQHLFKILLCSSLVLPLQNGLQFQFTPPQPQHYFSHSPGTDSSLVSATSRLHTPSIHRSVATPGATSLLKLLPRSQLALSPALAGTTSRFWFPIPASASSQLLLASSWFAPPLSSPTHFELHLHYFSPMALPPVLASAVSFFSLQTSIPAASTDLCSDQGYTTFLYSLSACSKSPVPAHTTFPAPHLLQTPLVLPLCMMLWNPELQLLNSGQENNSHRPWWSTLEIQVPFSLRQSVACTALSVSLIQIQQEVLVMAHDYPKRNLE